jgi:hypothetical protein
VKEINYDLLKPDPKRILHRKKHLACNNFDENRPEQYFAAHIILFLVVNMGSKILFRPVFNNIVTG